jgi:aspartyl-tRNA synthetase
LVVFAQLAPRHGWQVKWALDFPGSPSGIIEVVVFPALRAVSGPVTFGAGVSEKLKPGEHLGGVRAKFLARTYTAVATSLGLGKKSGFREKFGAKGEEVYICYPRHGVSVRDLDEIVKFFED